MEIIAWVILAPFIVLGLVKLHELLMGRKPNSVETRITQMRLQANAETIRYLADTLDKVCTGKLPANSDTQKEAAKKVIDITANTVADDLLGKPHDT